MVYIFAIASLAAFIAIIVGAFKPSMVLPATVPQTRFRAILLYCIYWLVFAMFASIAAPDEGEAVSWIWPLLTVGLIVLCWWGYKNQDKVEEWGKESSKSLSTPAKRKFQDPPKKEKRKKNRKEKTEQLIISFKYPVDTYTMCREARKRVVTVRSVYMLNGYTYIDGRCHMRQAMRTFRADRIRSKMTDAETGQQIKLSSLLHDKRVGSGRLSSFGWDSGSVKFSFPVFPYNEKTLVRITDGTDYESEFLSYLDEEELNNYNQERFEHDLEPYLLDIDVEEFPVLFEKRCTDILGLEPLPENFSLFYAELLDRQFDDEPLFWPLSEQTVNELVALGLFESFKQEYTEENVEDYLLGMTVPKLKELCGEHGIKKTQNKPGLVESLMQVQEKLVLPDMAKPTARLFELIEELGEVYIKDLEDQLQDKPDAYAANVWDQVAEEYGIGESLPKAAREAAAVNAKIYPLDF